MQKKKSFHDAIYRLKYHLIKALEPYGHIYEVFLILGVSFTICFLLFCLFVCNIQVLQNSICHGKAASFWLVTEARHFIQWMKQKMNNYLYLVLMIDGV